MLRIRHRQPHGNKLTGQDWFADHIIEDVEAVIQAAAASAKGDIAADMIPQDEKDKPNGIATLDATAMIKRELVPMALPTEALLADVTAELADLTAVTVDPGDLTVHFDNQLA